MTRLALKRLLERLGFVHVAGWVRKADAPKIRAKIEAARGEVEAVKDGLARNKPETESAPRAGISAPRRTQGVERKAEK